MLNRWIGGLAVAALASCTAPGPEEGPGRVVATSGEVRLTEPEVRLGVDALRLYGTDRTEPELRRQAAERVLARKLLAAEAKRRGLDREPAVLRDLERIHEALAMDLYALRLAGSDRIPEPELQALLDPIQGKVDVEQVEFRRRQFQEQWRLHLGVQRRLPELDALEPALQVWIDQGLIESFASAPADAVVARCGDLELFPADLARIFPPGSGAAGLEPERRRLLVRQALAFRVLARRKIDEGLLEQPAFRERREAEIEERLAEALRSHELDKSLEARPLDVEGYYREHRPEFEMPQEVRARHILVTHDGALRGRADRSREEAVALALGALERLRAGESFEAVARKASDLPEAAWDLGFFPQQGLVEQALADAAFQAATGEPVGPLHTRHGFHVLQVLERRVPGVRPFAEVEPLIRARLRRERKEAGSNELVRALRGQDELVLDPDFFAP